MLVREEKHVIALELVHVETKLHVRAARRQFRFNNLRVALGGIELLQSRKRRARW